VVAKILKKENGRLVAIIADLNSQLEHITGMVSRMMAAGPSAHTLEAQQTVMCTPAGFSVWDGSHPWTSEVHCAKGGSVVGSLLGGLESERGRALASIPRAHGEANILCCRLNPTLPFLVASGGADKEFRVFDWTHHTNVCGSGGGASASASCGGCGGCSGAESAARRHPPASLRCSAPVLTLEWRPCVGEPTDARWHVVALGCMDGSLTLAAVTVGGGCGGVDNDGVACASTENDRTGGEGFCAAVEHGSISVARLKCASKFAWSGLAGGGADDESDDEEKKEVPHKK
jgi:hypothetical protein